MEVDPLEWFLQFKIRISYQHGEISTKQEVMKNDLSLVDPLGAFENHSEEPRRNIKIKSKSIQWEKIKLKTIFQPDEQDRIENTTRTCYKAKMKSKLLCYQSTRSKLKCVKICWFDFLVLFHKMNKITKVGGHMMYFQEDVL